MRIDDLLDFEKLKSLRRDGRVKFHYYQPLTLLAITHTEKSQESGYPYSQTLGFVVDYMSGTVVSSPFLYNRGLHFSAFLLYFGVVYYDGMSNNDDV